jgi:hypothetical protein
MRKTMFSIAAVAGLLVSGPIFAIPTHPCSAALERLSSDFNAIGFQDVSKPGQAHVRGAAGHDHAGGQVTYMRQQIRLAYVDCEAGKVQAVHERVAHVRSMLQMPTF